jgi:hypothetical protein
MDGVWLNFKFVGYLTVCPLQPEVQMDYSSPQRGVVPLFLVDGEFWE